MVERKELNSILDGLKIDRSLLGKPQTDLPMLFHYGRADMTVSFFGANISPVDINEVIYLLPDISGKVNSFCISATEDNEGNKNLIIHLELQKNATVNSEEHTQFEKIFFSELAKINQDFREASRMATKVGQTTIQFHPNAKGPFTDNDIRIKAKYIH